MLVCFHGRHGFRGADHRHGADLFFFYYVYGLIHHRGRWVKAEVASRIDKEEEEAGYDDVTKIVVNMASEATGERAARSAEASLY